ncbi:transcriptional regulator FtsR [Demequina zhanjiangensis]|uniref:MerR family transcriptional regulator n=1 Tax=Demequina zhanjiangensis TaxID=3051659 RepID=A0ABT8G2S0_9MICO|nr:MerR family transcriptional regulator [Demequina sp. SYSU T00b26]MDN4473302.1 MerR family transcriptional regulator [Demequina sp. SYSU T00b26]
MPFAAHAASSPEPRARQGADARAAEGTWPHQLSHEPLLRVSDVLRLVQPEFPTLTPSKLRFLDSHGLVSPVRTPSGYRQYSPADVERVRFVLRQQRDHYRPLAVIAERLEALDAGTMHEAVSPRPTEDATPAYLDRDQLARAAGVDRSVVDACADSGLLGQESTSGFESEGVHAIVAARGYLEAGGDVRTLRALVRAADREAELAHAVAGPRRARGDAEGAEGAATAMADASVALFAAALRRASLS